MRKRTRKCVTVTGLRRIPSVDGAAREPLEGMGSARNAQSAARAMLVLAGFLVAASYLYRHSLGGEFVSVPQEFGDARFEVVFAGGWRFSAAKGR